MRRTTPLTAAATLGLALLAPTAPASAAGETCRGEAATLVGTSRSLTGTEGRDVIVTGDATDVVALGGNDVICVVPWRVDINVLNVDAGAGNDVVDTTGAPSSYYVDTDLGPGSDTLEGGDGGDWVVTGDAAGSSAEVDVVLANAGNDTVRTAGGSDVVDLGPGTNLVQLDGPGITAQGRLAGGDSYDTLKMTVASSSSSHVFDMSAGTYRTDGASALFSSFDSLDLDVHGGRVDYAGTGGRDHLDVETTGPPSTIVAAMLGGDDDLTIDRTVLGSGTRFDLGSGEDRLVAARPSWSLAIDLKRDLLLVAGVGFATSGVEDAFLMARSVSLVGDAQDNTLVAHACTSTITGGHGDDELIWDGDHVFEEYSFSCTKTARMRGGPGRDSLYGSPGDDRLTGGRGRDVADGAAGRDRCVAERERRCER